MLNTIIPTQATAKAASALEATLKTLTPGEHAAAVTVLDAALLTAITSTSEAIDKGTGAFGKMFGEADGRRTLSLAEQAKKSDNDAAYERMFGGRE